MRTTPSSASTRSFIVGAITIATLATAQDLSSLSSQCQAAAAGLLATPLASCLNIVSLVGVFSAQGSVIEPLNNWLGGACSADCSTDSLNNASASIQSACASDLTEGDTLAVGLQTLTSNYTEIKGVLCLQATSNNTYCLTNLLRGVQTATNTSITTEQVTSLVGTDPTAFTNFLSQVPASTLCTDCTHAQVSKITALANAAGVSATETQSALGSVSSTCGASFVDGQIPSTVREAGQSGSGSNTASGTAPTSTTPPGGSAAGLFLPSTLAVATIVGGWSLFL